MNPIKTLMRRARTAPQLQWLLLEAKYARAIMRQAGSEQAVHEDYLRHTGHRLDLNDPRRFTEKIQWYKLRYRNPLMPVLADKVAVKEYLAERGYGHLLNETIAVYDSVEQIRLEELPDRFVLKAAHASGWNLICRDKADLMRRWPAWKRVLRTWLRQDFSRYSGEWHYGQMPRRIICERYLENAAESLDDYKFFCFDGEPRLIQMDTGRFSRHVQQYYTTDWQRVDMQVIANPEGTEPAPRPEHLDEMLTLARELTAGFPQVRLDLYEYAGKVCFGEFTFFDGNGYYRMNPDRYDFIMGDWFVLPEIL